jgi:MerR family copper efflux transcriptional regulator
VTVLTIQQVSRRSGLSEPTLRYYEEVGLIGPIARDESSGHRRYGDEDLDVLQALACMRALGVGIEDMRVYQANRARGHAAAAEQRDLLLRHAERIEAEIAAQHIRLDYLREKAALWDARARGDAAAEAAAWQRANAAVERLLDLEALRPMKEARGEPRAQP